MSSSEFTYRCSKKTTLLPMVLFLIKHSSPNLCIDARKWKLWTLLREAWRFIKNLQCQFLFSKTFFYFFIGYELLFFMLCKAKHYDHIDRSFSLFIKENANCFMGMHVYVHERKCWKLKIVKRFKNYFFHTKNLLFNLNFNT